ncbi:hypothetical protein P7C70_g115, partial [Phenoliferia sp. Uapishka_3]
MYNSQTSQSLKPSDLNHLFLSTSSHRSIRAILPFPLPSPPPLPPTSSRTKLLYHQLPVPIFVRLSYYDLLQGPNLVVYLEIHVLQVMVAPETGASDEKQREETRSAPVALDAGEVEMMGSMRVVMIGVGTVDVRRLRRRDATRCVRVCEGGVPGVRGFVRNGGRGTANEGQYCIESRAKNMGSRGGARKGLFVSNSKGCPSFCSSSMANLLAEAEALLTQGEPNRGAQKHPHPRTVSRIVTRIQALTLELLPIQVDPVDLGSADIRPMPPDELMSPVSSIITKEVIEAYSKIGGDFYHCVPFALLEARRRFRLAAYTNPSDSDENEGRKLACEVLARKIVAKTPMAEQYSLLSARYTIVESDGDESNPISGGRDSHLGGVTPETHLVFLLPALESAVDQHATFFLSSNESQRCVFALWQGLLIQQEKADGAIEYTPYEGAKHTGGFFAHFNPSRVGVPRYQVRMFFIQNSSLILNIAVQFFFRIVLWMVFIVAYSLAIQTPDRQFGVEDVVLYIQLLGYMLEDLIKVSNFHRDLPSPTFEAYDKTTSSYPFGMILYYLWSILTLVILLNILGKTIAAIRAPDTYVYPAPFNRTGPKHIKTIPADIEDPVIEMCILPLEFVVPKRTYAAINRYLMGALFCVPIACIALFESQFDHRSGRDYKALTEEPDEFGSADEDPDPCTQSDDIGAGEEEGKKICTVSFAELKAAMPSLTRSTQGEILWELKAMRKELADMRAGKSKAE